MKLTISTILFSLLFMLPSFSQISQTHPELCGKPDGSVPLPPNVSATVDRSIGQGDLFLGPSDSAVKISIPEVVADVIDEVCPISGGRLVVFGSLGYELKNINIIDSAKTALLDSFDGFTPAMSPNQRWLVYRKFYPFHTELPVSEEYLLYDLSKTPAQNRPSGITLSDRMNVGKAIFPVGQKNLDGDHIGVPENQQHGMGSESFYWAPDSKAVIFGDLLQGKLSVVLVRLDADGNTTATVHSISLSDVCGTATNGGDLNHFESAEIGSEEGGDRLIRVRVHNSICTPKTLDFHLNDFQPAKTEVHVLEKPKRKAIIVDQ